MRGGEAARLRELSAEQRELRCELEAVHSEQTRQLSQARQEQLDLETRLEQLRQQACACEPGAQRQQEARYAEQVKTTAPPLSSDTAICHVHSSLHYCLFFNLSDICMRSCHICSMHKYTTFTSGKVKTLSTPQSYCFDLCSALGCRIPLLFALEAAVPPGLPPHGIAF